MIETLTLLLAALGVTGTWICAWFAWKQWKKHHPKESNPDRLNF